MTRYSILAALLVVVPVLFAAGSASAQWEGDSGYQLAAPTFTVDHAAAHATDQHRIGSALLATGLTANLVGAGAAFYSIISSFSVAYAGRCFDVCAPVQHPDWGALTAASLITSGVGLVLFFVGLGLDIHAHVLRGHATETSMALDARGLTVSF